MPKMMLEFIEAILASHPDLHVVGRVPDNSNLRAATRRYRADVLIVMQPNGRVLEADRMFWCSPSKVLAIAEGGRTGVMYVLRPQATRFADLSADILVDASR
jgi:hypothetical protein